MFHFDSALREHLIKHVTQMVAQTTLETAPFPHVLIRGFLPEDVYQELHSLLPHADLYEPFGYEKHQAPDGKSNRLRFEMSNAWLDKISGRSRKFWYSIRSALGSAELKHAVFTKLSPGLSFRYGISQNAVPELPGFALPELFRETEGYSIKPHPDTRRKVVTMQIALASDDSQEPLGTEFYERSLNPLTWLREPRGFDISRRMPFLPNTAYAFSVLNTLRLKSWHGRTKIPGEFGTRHSLLNIWYATAEDTNPDLIAEHEELLQTQRARAA